MNEPTPYDVAIVGGGPAGLSAALILGRARLRVALFDALTPRNAAAEHIHGFVTRDGTPPAEFRRVGRAQLEPYANVEVRDAEVASVAPDGALFTVRASTGTVVARRVLLAVGMIDELPDLPGYRALWGRSVFQCPFCHGWEVQDRALGVLITNPMFAEFALFLTAWSRDVVVFTGGAFEVAAELRARFDVAGVAVETRALAALHARDGRLDAVELVGGGRVACEALFVRPPQRHAALVGALGLALDEQGYVRVDDQQRTSVPGVLAAGDLTSMRQGALVAAAAGAMAGYGLAHALTAEAREREARAGTDPRTPSPQAGGT